MTNLHTGFPDFKGGFTIFYISHIIRAVVMIQAPLESLFNVLSSDTKIMTLPQQVSRK